MLNFCIFMPLHGAYEMRSWIYLPLLLLCTLVSGEELQYKLGQGLKLDDMLTIGGYISSEYEHAKKEESVKIDDLALIAYGNMGESFSYLTELEAINFYTYDMEQHQSETNKKFHIERLYVDYASSDIFKLRAGKFITPVGYWNLEPINVLRDTTSNPIYASSMIPRFVTGVNLYGYLPFDDTAQYYLFGQKTEDFDEEYINIKNEHFFGAGIAKEMSGEWHVGASAGEFITLDKEHFYFLQANTKYESYPFKIMAEAIYRTSKDTRENSSYAAYVQGHYNFSLEHMLVSRVEAYKEENISDGGEELFLLGYSYRPIYPVSIKAEYQWHSIAKKDRFVASFSVLF